MTSSPNLHINTETSSQSSSGPIFLSIETADPGIVQGTPTHRQRSRSRDASEYRAGSDLAMEATRENVHYIMDTNPLLSPSEYKDLLITEGLLSPNSQEHVFHVIPRQFGGANHVDNLVHGPPALYKRARPNGHSPVSSSPFFEGWTPEWDGIAMTAFHIGLTHISKAIAVSSTIGNTKTGVKYTGPTPETLWERGRDLNREVRKRQQASGLERPLGGDDDKLKLSPTSPTAPRPKSPTSPTAAPKMDPFADPSVASQSSSFSSTSTTSEKPRRKSFVEKLFGK